MKRQRQVVTQDATLHDDGWQTYSIWEHSRATQELYARRCRQAEPEMTCAAQAAELLAPLVKPGEGVLDAGCGSGYFYHSLTARRLPVHYQGIDASPTMIGIGQKYLPAFGLLPDFLRVLRIEDMRGYVDHIVCMNVLSNIDNYHRPLERLLQSARKTVILRESLHTEATYAYVVDQHLDGGVSLKTYVNTYCLSEVIDFIESYGYQAAVIVDRYTGGQAQLVIDYPHYWTFVVAQRR